MKHRFTLAALIIAVGCAPSFAADEFPPGWLPIQKLDDKAVWADFRKIDDKIHLYMPPNVETVRGVFVCFVFHSSDPRELARLWKFALVTVPWPFEYDLGKNDKRNGRFKLGHPVGNMSFLLRYLDHAAKELKHPELAVAPIVGWLGQNGAGMCNDLFQRAPDRVLAWGDAWYADWPKYPELIKRVPVASAWEFTSKDEKDRKGVRDTKFDMIKDKPTPANDLRCYASTYGFPHGIYSKYSFFMAYIDRCIIARLPEQTPPAGQAVKLRPIEREKGWVGDFNEVGEWNPIAPFAEAKSMVDPMWMPDAYAAWMWRSYHSAKPDLKLTSPVIEYRKADGKWGGPECGLGYGGPLKADSLLRFAAELKGEYAKVEFHDGDKIVGTASAAPWQVENIALERGLHTLFAVGVKADGTRRASRPAFLIVE